MPKIYTFKNLQDEVLGWLDETNTTGVSRTNVKNSIQQALIRRLAMRDWNFMLWPTAKTFTAYTGTRMYPLHNECSKVLYMYNRTTKAYLTELNKRQLSASGARWNTDTGMANKYVLWGRWPVENQPEVGGGTLLATSSSGSDTTQTVTVTGNDSSGKYLVSETLTLTGTSAVAGTVTFTNPIVSVTVSAPCAGELTIQCGGIMLLFLYPGELARSFPVIEMLHDPTPNSTVEYRFYRQPTELVDDNDIPDIPPPFTQILVWDALIDMAAYNTDVDMKNVQLWARNQQKLEDAMIEWDDEGSTIDAEPRYVRNLDVEGDGIPRVYSS